MRTRTLKAVRATVVAGLVTGALAAGPVASAPQEPGPGGCTTADRKLIEELVRTEAVFHKATPGSPAQFRSLEAAYELREKLFSDG